jgi:hypothetical protein
MERLQKIFLLLFLCFFVDQCGKGAFGAVYVATHKSYASSGNNTRSPTWSKVAIKETSPTVLDRRGGVRIWTHDQVEDRCQEIKALIKLKEENLHYSSVLYVPHV